MKKEMQMGRNKKPERKGEREFDRVWKENKKFWKELIAYYPLIRCGPHRRRGV
jgi:hypothetical protein